MDSKNEQFRNAAWNGDVQTIHALMLSQDVNINNTDGFGKTALINAASACNITMIHALMNFQPNIEKKDDCGRTVLNWSIFMGHIEGVKYFIEAGSNIETTDIKGRTPLIQAARMNSIDTVHALINAGANLEHLDNNKLSAFDYAKQNGHKAVAELLKNLTKERKNSRINARIANHRNLRKYIQNRKL